MGSTQSSQALIEEEYVNGVTEQREELENQLMKKVLQQEPEMLPCHASSSPLSPQLSTVGTPRRLGSSSIKVWDPCNVLGPPPPPSTTFSRSFLSDTLDEDQTIITEVFLISHGECGFINLRPDLTQNGKRQARALAVLLSSQGVRFNAVYSSPLDRTRTTAATVCQHGNLVYLQSGNASSGGIINCETTSRLADQESERYCTSQASLVSSKKPNVLLQFEQIKSTSGRYGQSYDFV